MVEIIRMDFDKDIKNVKDNNFNKCEDRYEVIDERFGFVENKFEI